MTCKQFKQLQDAYLDCTLNGALRLEVDAHRLRCQRCQQRLAMLEAIGHTVASDIDIPALSADFTDRLIATVHRRQPLSRRTLSVRIAFAGAAVLQAAAVLFFAIVLQPTPAELGASLGSAFTVADRPDESVPPSLAAQFSDVDVFEALSVGVEVRLKVAQATGQTISDEARAAARYLNIMLPDDVESTVNLATIDPTAGILDTLFPAAHEEATDTVTSTATDVYSL